MGAVTEADLAPPRAGDQAQLFADTGALGGHVEPSSGGGIGAGRPKGSTNRATRDRRAFYLSRYPDPLEGAIAWAMPGDLLEGVRRARGLARLLGCTPLEALEFMRKSGADAMPYLHAKALEVDVNNRSVNVSIGLGKPPAAGVGMADGLAQLRAEFEREAGAVLDVIAQEIDPDDDAESVEKSDG